MTHHTVRRDRFITARRLPAALVLGALALGASACGRRADDRGDSAALAGTARESASSRQGNGVPAAAAAPATGTALQLSDTALVEFLASVDKAEIEVGRLAADKGKRREVKAFGREMVDAHRQDLAALKRLDGMSGVTDRNTPSRLPSTDSLGDSSARRMGNAGATGSDPSVTDLVNTMQQAGERLRTLDTNFDTEYADAQVMGHQRVLDVLLANTGRMMTEGVRDHLAAVTAAVQKHLASAKELQQTLAAAPARPTP